MTLPTEWPTDADIGVQKKKCANPLCRRTFECGPHHEGNLCWSCQQSSMGFLNLETSSATVPDQMEPPADSGIKGMIAERQKAIMPQQGSMHSAIPGTGTPHRR